MNIHSLFENFGGKLTVNNSVITKYPSEKIYCEEDYAQELYNQMYNTTFFQSPQKKDIDCGEVVKTCGFYGFEKKKILLLTENDIIITINFKEDWLHLMSKALEISTKEDLFNWLSHRENSETFFERNSFSVLITTINNSGVFGSISAATELSLKEEFFVELKNPTKTYTAKIFEKNSGGYLATIDGIVVFLPGSQAAPNKIVNFDALVGESIKVMIENYIAQADRFVVSHKKFIQHNVQKLSEHIDFSTKYAGRITGIAAFGIFVEFENFLTGLLHVSEMLPETKERFENKEFVPRDEVIFYVKEVDDKKRFVLSQYINIANATEDTPYLNHYLGMFKSQFEGTIQEGEITGIKKYGIFVKFKTATGEYISGLLPSKEYELKEEVKIGQYINVHIQEVDLASKHVHLKARDFNTVEKE